MTALFLDTPAPIPSSEGWPGGPGWVLSAGSWDDASHVLKGKGRTLTTRFLDTLGPIRYTGLADVQRTGKGGGL